MDYHFPQQSLPGALVHGTFYLRGTQLGVGGGVSGGVRIRWGEDSVSLFGAK